MLTPLDKLEARRSVVAPREITGTVKLVNEALFTCTVTYPRTRGKRPDDHGVSLKVTGGDLFGVYVIPAVGSTVRLLRKGAGQGYFVADCNQPAKLVIRSMGMVGVGSELVADFLLGTWVFDKGTEPAVLGSKLQLWLTSTPVRPWCPLGPVPANCFSKRIFLED